MTSPPKYAAPGFTLIEIIVVLTILGLMLSLLIVRGPIRSEAMEDRVAVDAVATTLRGARGAAIAANRRVAVVFDLAAHTLRIDGGPSRPLPDRIGLVVISTTGNTHAQSLAEIAFAPDGSSSGGRVELLNGPRQTVIGVDWLTGRVSVTDAQ